MGPSKSSPGTAEAGWIDRWPARLAALLVVVLCAMFIAWVHRNDLFPEEVPDGLADDPAAACIAVRYGEVDKMRSDGVIDDAQSALFKSRAEAFCRAQAGQGGAPPPPQ